MDRLNNILSLNISTTQSEKIYFKNIFEKMNDKLKKDIVQTILIFDNFRKDFKKE